MEADLLKQHLMNTYLFSNLNTEDYDLIINQSATIHFNKGELIYKEGSFVNNAYYLLDGYAKVFVEKNNRIRIIKIIKPYWFVGILSINSYEKYEYSAQAITSCTIRQVNREALLSVLRSNPEFAEKYTRVISLLSISLVKFLAIQNQKNVRGRIADIILHLADNIYQNSTFELNFTRRELAELANTSTETAIRLLNDFRKDKLIDIDDQKITVLNRELLVKSAEMG
jgi:CRP-like cAMP-binding protein